MADKKFTIASKKYRGETSVVSIRLPNDLVEALDEIAQSTGRTRNDVVQQCLEYSIENLEIQ